MVLGVLEEMLKAMLDQNQFSIKCLNSSIEGLKELSQNNYNVLISDFRMPKMNGYQLLDKIQKQKNNNSMKVFMITGEPFLNIPDQFSNIQIYKKPVDISSIVSQIKQIN